MHRRRRRLGRVRVHAIALAILCGAGAAAQPRTTEPAATTLQQAFEAAWSRQPEAAALRLRRDAARAQQDAAQAWTPEPPALALSNKTDRFNRDLGARELEVGVAIPLWLPGERAGSGALADAEAAGVESRALAARLRLAGALREAWWQWQRAQVDIDLARDQVANARLLAADVERRVKAGDLARADQHQADGAVAAAEAAAARAQAARRERCAAIARRDGRHACHRHPVQRSGAPHRARAARRSGASRRRRAPCDPGLAAPRWPWPTRTAALSAVRTRANPELLIAATRERDLRGERYDPSITLALRIPFGAGSRDIGPDGQPRRPKPSSCRRSWRWSANASPPSTRRRANA